MDQRWLAYRDTLSKELGDDLAREFVDSLYARSQGDIDKATAFFYELGMTWAPLVHAWGAWTQAHAKGTVAIIMRDAKPLTALPLAKHWKQLYLNRRICGVPDELSGDCESRQHPLLNQYLEQSHCSGEFTFVDSGCYGTVVLELHKLGIRFQPLFFFSKNPSIRGFVNECGLTLQEGEILNDSLECGFPHTWLRPTSFAVGRDGKVEPIICPADDLSIAFGQATMEGVREMRPRPGLQGCEAAEKLLRLSERARRGEFTGVLGHTSPEWSKKAEFLANWPKELCWT